MANTALMPGLESEVLNWSLRATAPSARGGLFYLVFLTNSTADNTITELAAAGSYTGATGRPAFLPLTSGQQWSTTAASNVASTAGAPLVNAQAITFTATATHTGIVGIGISTSAAVGGTTTAVQSEATLHYYGDLTGGSVTLTAGQSITFAAGAISISIE
jgi:hypothetical protein